MEQLSEEGHLVHRDKNPIFLSKPILTRLSNLKLAPGNLTSSYDTQKLVDNIFNDNPYRNKLKHNEYNKMSKSQKFKNPSRCKSTATGFPKHKVSEANVTFKRLSRNNFRDSKLISNRYSAKEEISNSCEKLTQSFGTKEFLENSKLKVDNTLLSKENNKIKNLLRGFISESEKKSLTKKIHIKKSHLPNTNANTKNNTVLVNIHDGQIESYANENKEREPNSFRSEASENSQTIKEDKQLVAQKRSYFKALSCKIDNSISRSATIDTEIDDMDFPVNNDYSEHKEHYRDRFTYKLYTYKRDLVAMKNVFDSMSDEETFEDKTWYLINPAGPFKMTWDAFAIFFAIYNIITIPYELAFDIMDMAKFYRHMFLDIFFTTDAVLSFFTGYYQDDKLIRNVRKIIQHNATSLGWYLSLISAFPFESLMYLIEPNYLDYNLLYNQRNAYNHLFKVYKYVRYLKWLQLYRILNLTYKLETLQIGMKRVIHLNMYLKKMLSYFAAFLLLIYLATCFWCYLGFRDMYDIEGTWITFYNLTDSDEMDIFVAALYYILATMFTIGYGDITPHNIYEHLYVSLLMTIGSVIWSFLLTAFSQFFIDNDEKTSVLKDKLNILGILKKEHNLSEGFIDRIKKSLFFDFKAYSKDRLELINYLPVHLRNELYLSMYKTQVTHLKFFKDQSYDFISTVLPLLKTIQLHQDESVISKGDIVKDLYMIIKGILSVKLTIGKSKIELCEVRSSFHIGDILMYMEDQSPYDILVKTKVCDLFVLSRHDFAELKLSFKDAISNILMQSHEDFCKIEQKRNRAMDFYDQNNTFLGFKINHNESMLFTSSEIGKLVNKKMTQISTQIAKEKKLDSILSKERTSKTNSPSNVKSSQNLEIVEEKGTKNYFSCSSSSSISSEKLENEDNKLSLKKSKGLKLIIKPFEKSPEIAEEIKEKLLSPSKNKSQSSDSPSKKSPSKNSSGSCVFFPFDVGKKRGSLFLNTDQKQKFSFKRMISNDKAGEQDFIEALNQKIFQDIAIQRNPEIVQDQLVNFIAQNNINNIEKQVKKLDKMFSRLNEILVMKLKKKDKNFN
jgi:hypothetical protein